MDEEARRKEAERTLHRIKGTLKHLEDGSAWDDPVTENEEILRIKKLIESGYSHEQPGLFNRLYSLASRPVFLVSLLIAILLLAGYLRS